MPEEHLDAHILGVTLVQQYSLKKGRELFGEKTDTVVTKEIKQINDLEMYKPILASYLPWEDKKKALQLLLFITEKRNGDIKARKIDDGSKQCTYDGYYKSDGSSSMTVTEIIFMTGVVDAHKGRHMAVLVVDNAFLYADNDENAIMLLRDKLAEMMVRVDPSLYRKYLTYSAT
jgi:hypothetical protein